VISHPLYHHATAAGKNVTLKLKFVSGSIVVEQVTSDREIEGLNPPSCRSKPREKSLSFTINEIKIEQIN